MLEIEKKNKKFWVILIIGGYITVCILFGIFGFKNTYEPPGDTNRNIFVIKYDSNGAILWEIISGGSGYEVGYDIAIDKKNNIYVVGYTFSYGLGGDDVYLLKINSNGEILWKKTWGGPNGEIGYSITIDNISNIYITGYTHSFGEGESDAFIVKYNSTGTQLWNTTWGGSEIDVGKSIAIDNTSNIYITGYTRNFGAGESDAFIVKYNSTGAQLWNTTWGGDNTDLGHGITIDNKSNIYVTGYTDVFGPGESDAFIVKYNSTGTQLWNKTWGGVGHDFANAITQDNETNVYITGTTYSFGAGKSDIFIVKYNSTGTQLWNKTWGQSNIDLGKDITVDNINNIYITGKSKYESYDETDYIILKFDSIGNILSTIKSNRENDYTGQGIIVDSLNNLYLTGYVHNFHID